MQGQRGLSTNSSEYNAQDFMISQMLGRIATAEPVRVVAVSGDKIVDYDVNVALSMHKTIDRDMIEIANAISI